MIEVAVAVIRYEKWFLVATRDKNAHQGGKLEFVGGKVETDETPLQALWREVYEELGVGIKQLPQRFLGKICHDYGDKTVCLMVYEVQLDDPIYRTLKSQTQGQQGQALSWLDKSSLLDKIEAMPQANRVIMDWL